jgi:4-hydroxybenzoyl-CoA thioesterase
MPPFKTRIPVRFSDVDEARIVYYPMFFHYFHLAFEELFRARFGPDGMARILNQERIGFPAVHAECDFRSPLRFGDEADIELCVERVGNKSLTFVYRVSRAADGKVSAEGRVICAVTDLNRFRAVDIPPALRSLFLELGEKNR